MRVRMLRSMTVAGNPGSIAERTLAIVVHYGDPALTEQCLRSIDAGRTRPGLLVVVDNGPEPLDPAMLDLMGTPHHLIRPGENAGFAAGVNLAIAAHPGFDRAWLLNNDAVAEPGALQELVEAAGRAAGPALISSLIMDTDTGEVWFERARFYPWRLESRHNRVHGSPDADTIDPGRPSMLGVPYLPGCSVLVPTDIAGSWGLLDPAFFVYGEDIDLALRATDRGWPLIVARRSVVRHRPSSGASEATRERLLAESGSRIVRRRYPLLLPFSVFSGLALGVLRGILERRRYRVEARVEGYASGLRRAPARRR